MELTSMRNIGKEIARKLNSVDNIDYNQLSEETKRELKTFSDSLK